MELEKFKKDMQHLKEDSVKSIEQLKECISQDNSPELELIYHTYAKGLGETINESEKIILVLESLANFIEICDYFNYSPYYSISLEEIKRISKLYQAFEKDKDSIKEKVDRFFLVNCDAIYIRELLFSKWSKGNLSNARLKIIEESIMCFEKGLFFAAIPLVFSQLEGMVADIKHTKEKMSGKNLDNYIKELFDMDIYEDLLFDKLLKRIYQEEIRVGFEHKKQLKSDFGRHAIMHGGDVNYGTPHNYIRVILFFDSVYERLIGYEQRKESINRKVTKY